MPFFKLSATARKAPTSAVQEISLTRDEEGKIEHWLSTEVAREIPAEIFEKAEKFAQRLGFKIVEAPAPDEDEDSQPVGDDVVGMSPVNVAGVQKTDQQAGAQELPTTTAPAETPSPGQVQSPGSPSPLGSGLAGNSNS